MKNKIIDMHSSYHNVADTASFDEYSRNNALKDLYPQQHTKKKKILDVGCGAGIVGEFFLKNNYDVYGIEIHPQAAKIAKKKGIHITSDDIGKGFSFQNKFFDEIFMGDIIEHLYDPEKTIQECYRVLKPGGRLILSTVNYGNIIWRLQYLLRGKLSISEGGDKNKNIGYWEHIRLWDDNSLVSFITAQKFRYIKTVGTNYFGIFPSLLYSRYPFLFSALNIYIFKK